MTRQQGVICKVIRWASWMAPVFTGMSGKTRANTRIQRVSLYPWQGRRFGQGVRLLHAGETLPAEQLRVRQLVFRSVGTPMKMGVTLCKKV